MNNRRRPYPPPATWLQRSESATRNRAYGLSTEHQTTPSHFGFLSPRGSGASCPRRESSGRQSTARHLHLSLDRVVKSVAPCFSPVCQVAWSIGTRPLVVLWTPGVRDAYDCLAHRSNLRSRQPTMSPKRRPKNRSGMVLRRNRIDASRGDRFRRTWNRRSASGQAAFGSRQPKIPSRHARQRPGNLDVDDWRNRCDVFTLSASA